MSDPREGNDRLLLDTAAYLLMLDISTRLQRVESGVNLLLADLGCKEEPRRCIAAGCIRTAPGQYLYCDPCGSRAPADTSTCAGHGCKNIAHLVTSRFCGACRVRAEDQGFRKDPSKGHKKTCKGCGRLAIPEWSTAPLCLDCAP